MPPLVIWAVGAIGAVALTKLLAAASRRANADLESIRRERAVERPVETLEQDPQTGEYRPRGNA
jgi:hypothetical protein